MKSVEELRLEARRLRETVDKISDPALKRELAERALELAERAEAIERAQEDPEIVRANIVRYRSMLAAGIADGNQKRIVEEMLRDAEEIIANRRSQQS